jgi:ATP-dependent Clp protease adaptor protein ClpS
MSTDETKPEPKLPEGESPAESSEGATATRPAPAKPTPRQLPPWKVLLHNDDVNDIQFVVETIVMLTPLAMQDAVLRMKEAHDTGVALLLTTHRERAELYQLQFSSRNLTVTIEPA